MNFLVVNDVYLNMSRKQQAGKTDLDITGNFVHNAESSYPFQVEFKPLKSRTPERTYKIMM